LVETTFRGASWGADGYIVFNPSPVRGNLLRVSAAGGKLESISTLNGDEAAHRWPQVLPGARFVLFTAVITMSGVDDARIVVQPLPSGPSKVVLRGAYFGRYLQSGHLVYMQESTLFSVPFDLERLEVTGQPVAVVHGVLSASEGASSWFDVSNEGTLAYVAGQRTSNEVLLQWMGRDGVTTPMRDVPTDWRNPQFAPDGQHLALGVLEAGQTDLWVYEWANGAMTRLTVDSGQDTSPVWSPDGRSIVFASDRGANRTLNLYWQSADGSGDAHRLTESETNQRPTSWHPSGRYIAFQDVTKQGQANIMILPMESNGGNWKAGAPITFLSHDKLNAANAMFSPDGRWLAYQSNEAGRVEVFVRPFPGPGGRWQVSSSGGQIPTWSRRRSELFFDSLQDNRLMVLSYAADGSTFRANPPQRWSEQAIQLRPGNRPFDLHPDGDRVVVSATREASGMPDKVVLVTNFFDELRRVTTASR
jgi:serine/threonine-protein kinase